MHTLVTLSFSLLLVGQTTRPSEASANAIDAPPIKVFHDSSKYVSFPDVKRLPDGRLLTTFRYATYPEKIKHIEVDARIVGSISKDGGLSWSEPELIYDSEACQNDPSIAVLADGRLLMTFFEWVGRSKEYVESHKPSRAIRVDRGQWGDYADLDGVSVLWGKADPLSWEKKPEHLIGTPMMHRATSASVLQTKKGTLLMPLYGSSKGDPASRAYLLRSADGGKTWGKEILMAADPANKVGMFEPSFVQTKEGDIVTTIRTSNANDHLYVARSADDGLTWSPVEKTSIVGHPTDMLLLPDGRILMVYGYRHEPFGVRACTSNDGGKTWDPKHEIVITASGRHGDLGYPSVCMADDKTVVVVYYMNGPEQHQRWIECKRIPLEKLK